MRSQRSSGLSRSPKAGIGLSPWPIHQKRSPAVCSATWCARRSGGRGFSAAAAGPSPPPRGPWQATQCSAKSARPSAIDAA